MRDLPFQRTKTEVTDDLGGAEILEFGRVRAALGGQPDQLFRANEVSVVIGRDIRYEVCRGPVSDQAFAYKELRHALQLLLSPSIKRQIRTCAVGGRDVVQWKRPASAYATLVPLWMSADWCSVAG